MKNGCLLLVCMKNDYYLWAISVLILVHVKKLNRKLPVSKANGRMPSKHRSGQKLFVYFIFLVLCSHR